MYRVSKTPRISFAMDFVCNFRVIRLMKDVLLRDKFKESRTLSGFSSCRMTSSNDIREDQNIFEFSLQEVIGRQ